MDEQRVQEIQKRMNEKDTETLCAIWIKNDRHECSNEEFEAIRRLLNNRGVVPPRQSRAPLDSVFAFLKNLGAIGAVVLFLFLLTTPFMVMHWFDNRKRWNEEKTLLEQQREALLNDFQGTNTTKRIAAVKALRHDESLIPLLVQGLENNGDPQLALMYCNESETPELLTAGIKWLQSRGWQVWKSTSRGQSVYFVRPGTHGTTNSIE